MPINKEAIAIEYRRTYAEMKGISPKLALYAELEKKLKELKIRMDGSNITGVGKFLSRKENRIVKIKKGSSRSEFSGRIVEEKKVTCNIEGCTKQRASKGRTSRGIQKYQTRCREHLKQAKRANKLK